jgi:hypothetical protein
MATTTPNFGWAVPTSTDLVKDGAVAIETLGDAIDASLVDLKGGTTGQVLAKASGTDMDFTWTTSSAGMTNPMTTTGDTIYSSSGSTPARLGIGSTGNVLTVAGGVPTWAAPAGGGKVAQVLAYQGTNTVALTTSYQTVDSLTITPSATTSKIYASIVIKLNSKNTSGASDSSVKAALFRGATQVGNASVNQTSFMQVTQNDGGPVITIPLVYLDSPATTSATTYNVKALDSWTTRTSYASDCYITLWEVLA